MINNLNKLFYKSVLYNSWSKKYIPSIKELDITQLISTKSNIFKNNIKNIGICLSYTDLIVAYSNNTKIDIFFKMNSISYSFIFKNKLPIILLIYNNNNIIIIFKGTSSIFELFLNMNINLKSINKKNIKVHGGMYNFFSKFKLELITKIDDILLKKNIKNIYLTGHSLGGSLSILCGYLLYEKYNNLQFYNYCMAPLKVGNKDFVEAYNKLNIITFIIINESDIIPKLPFLNKYNHIDTKCIYFNYKKNKIQNHSSEIYYNFIKKALELYNSIDYIQLTESDT